MSAPQGRTTLKRLPPEKSLGLRVRKCVVMCVGVFLHMAQRVELVPAGVELNVTA